MKNIITTIFIILGLTAHTQSTTDILYLQNGSIIKGKIIEKTNDTTKIETCCGSIFAYTSVEIDRTEILNDPLPGYLKSSGYFNYTSMGLLLGSGSNDYQGILSILMEHNYQLNQYFAFGAVIGIEIFNETVAPVGINTKGILPLKGKSNLFINLSSGYSIPIEDAAETAYLEFLETKGGVFANSEIGIIVPSKSNINFFVALGYRYNELNYTREDWYYDEIERKVTYNRFSIKLGVVLH